MTSIAIEMKTIQDVVDDSEFLRTKNRINKKCSIDDIEITIVSIKTGKAVIGKHIDTQVIFFVNRSKVVCHFYNTTQLILVNGNGYANFVNHFLKPFFESKIPIYEKKLIAITTLCWTLLAAGKLRGLMLGIMQDLHFHV